MDKIKRFIDCYIPVTTCTLRCHYCYITMHRMFNGPLPIFTYSPQHVRKALSKERLGGVCLFNLCGGGETMLAPQITDYVKELLCEGHYVMIVTNGTITKRIEELITLDIELRERLFIKFSYHFLELHKRDLSSIFFENIKKVRAAGCSFSIEITPSDELIPYIADVKLESLTNTGALPHVTIARDERQPKGLPILTSLSQEEYQRVWSNFQSNLFDFKLSIFGKKRKEFCYAGIWSLYLNIATGETSQCYFSRFKQNIFEDVNKPIRFEPIGWHCQEHHCYNGHAWLTLGDIPELKCPYLDEMRNRRDLNGHEWLTPQMRSFMHTKLYETNREYSFFEKIACEINYYLSKAKWKTKR